MTGTGPLNPLPQAHFDKSIDEIKEMLRDMQTRLRELETREAGASPLVNSKLDALWRKADIDTVRITALEKTAIENKQSITLTTWIGSITGGAIILFIINAILHNTFILP